MLVKKHSAEELAERIKSRSVISKDKVIRESQLLLHFYLGDAWPANDLV